jgi:di/tripeptidase
MARDFDRSVGTTIHGRNERIDVASLHFQSEFLMALAENFLAQ